MIKLVCFIRKRADLDREAFHAHWLETHGPLIAGIPELRRHLVRYEQNHRLEADCSREKLRDEPHADGDGGATIMWFESMAEYHAFAAEPAYAARIAPDEARFMDRSQTMYFFTEEEEVKLGGPATQARASVKLLALLKRKPGLPLREFHEHWSGPHADLFTQTPALRERILAYQQNHRFEADYARDPATEWDGLAEQWYESVDAFYAGAAGAPFEEIVAPDEELFMDRAATRFILCRPPDVIVS